jgi:predicted  nucleic acid-binding Zn-ribbon protein
MSDLPKILSKREIELEELEEAKYVQSLRDDIEKLQEQLNTAKKNIEHAIGTIKHDGHLGTIQTDWILPDLEKALAAIGGDK